MLQLSKSCKSRRVIELKLLVNSSSIIYSIALRISKAIPNGGKIKFDTLVDFHGLYDARYAVLVIGGFLINFGLWVPGYHISKQFKFKMRTTKSE